MKRRVLVALLAALLVACMVQPVVPALAEDEAIVLNIMHFYTKESAENPGSNKSWRAMMDKYIEQHPNVTLNETTMTQADYHPKVMALAAADEMPDIFFTKGSWVQNFYDNNLMADLTDYFDESVYREGLLGPYCRDGKIFAIPLSLSTTSIVYYNKALWNEIGYEDFPTTWEELIAAGPLFEEKGIIPMALGNKDKWPFESCIISTLGNRITGSDWTWSVINNDGTAKFTDPDFVRVLDYSQQMAALFNKDFNAITDQEALDLFVTGRAASQITGVWNMGYCLANADDDVLDNICFSYLPAVTDMKGEPNAVSGGAGWSQSVSSKLTGAAFEAAVEFVQQTSGVEFSTHLMNDAGVMGQCIVDKGDISSFPPMTQRYLEYIDTLSFIPIYDIYMDASVIDVMNSKLQELLSGTETPDGLAQALQVEQDKLP